MGRRGRRVPAPLVIDRAHAPCRSGRDRGHEEMGAHSRRSFHRAGVGKCGSGAEPRGGARAPAPPGHARSHRTPAHAGGARGVYARPIARRLRPRGRPPAGDRCLRRAVRPPVAGCDPLCGYTWHPHRQLPLDLAVPRLGSRGVSAESAVRSVHRRADGGRSPARADARPESRLRLQPLPLHDQRGRRDRGRIRGDLREGPRRDDVHCLAGPHHGLRHVPRPQVRPDQHEGFLRAHRVFPQ